MSLDTCVTDNKPRKGALKARPFLLFLWANGGLQRQPPATLLDTTLLNVA